MAVVQPSTDAEIREQARRLGCPEYLLDSARTVGVNYITGAFEVRGPGWSYHGGQRNDILTFENPFLEKHFRERGLA